MQLQEHTISPGRDMIFDSANSAINGAKTAIRIPAMLLVGFMMVFPVGLPLALGGRPEAAVPLIIGSLSLFNALRLIKQIAKK